MCPLPGEQLETSRPKAIQELQGALPSEAPLTCCTQEVSRKSQGKWTPRDGASGSGNTGKLSPGSQDECDKTSARPAGRTAGSGRVPSLPGLPHSPAVSKAGPGHPDSLHAPWPLPKQVCAAPNTMRRAPLLRVRFSGCTAEMGPPRASSAKRPGSLGHRCACTQWTGRPAPERHAPHLSQRTQDPGPRTGSLPGHVTLRPTEWLLLTEGMVRCREPAWPWRPWKQPQPPGHPGQGEPHPGAAPGCPGLLAGSTGL